MIEEKDIEGIVYSLDEFKAKFEIGDYIIFYYPDGSGDRQYIFGKVRKYLMPDSSSYKNGGGIEFDYYRIGEEDLSDLRDGDIDIEHIYGPRLLKDEEFLI